MRLQPCRHARIRAATALLLVAGTGAAAVPAADHHLVACAPGYPGSPEQAQPTLDAFAAMIADASGWPGGSLTAEYTTDERAGIEAIAAGADLTIVPTPFFLVHAQELDLRPLVQAVPPDGDAEVWSLVAARGRIATPGDLTDWEVTGVPGYAPAFVRGAILGDWGPLPDTVRITFTDRALGALRRALAGEPVAVLLERSQVAALPSLPDGERLEVVARSAPMPPLLLATVDDRLAPTDVERVRAALLGLHQSPRFTEVLETLRLSRFEPLDEARLDALRAAVRAAS